MTTPMSDTQILERLCALAAEQVGMDASAVTPESDFYRDLNFDSLDAAEFTMKLEDEFDITIDDAQGSDVRTPKQAKELLQGVLRGTAG